MPNSLEKLGDRDLNRMVAEKVMGWKPGGSRCGRENCITYDNGWRTLSGCPCNEDMEKNPYTYSPSSDISAAYSMETEIEKQGKYLIYIEELALVINGHWPDPLNLSELFRMVHASPRQRVLAALKTYGVQAPETKNV